MNQECKETNILEIRNLSVSFKGETVVKAVSGVSFEVKENEILGIVGESGSGKSVTCLSVCRLIPFPPAFIEKGEIIYQGRDLLQLSWEEVRNYRGKEISYIFQEPMTSLNPVYPIKMQLKEVLKIHENISEKEALEKSIKMLDSLGIPNASKRIHDYPHQFSGGMRQRVMIAMALIANPKLLIADEPTTALDVTVQAQILDLLMKTKQQRKEMSVVLITHNLALVAQICDRVLVMYGGQIQESASVKCFFDSPAHPYTKGLLACLPGVSTKLKPIPGQVPDAGKFPKGCKFWPRCEHAMKVCRENDPELTEIADKHFVRCFLYQRENKPDDSE